MDERGIIHRDLKLVNIKLREGRKRQRRPYRPHPPRRKEWPVTKFQPGIIEGRAHRALPESDLEQILLHVPAGVAILEGPDFRYSYVNDRLAEINGLRVEDHLGKPLADVLPAAAPDILPRLRQVMESRTPAKDHEFSTVLPGSPTRVRHFVVSFFPIVGQDGNVNAVCAVVLDITERKHL